jgi:hypothetical protein
LAAKIVVDRVLQDALEKHRQFGRGLCGVFLSQLEHRVLHHIERGVLVSHGEHCLLECAAFDPCQEGGQFLG